MATALPTGIGQTPAALTRALGPVLLLTGIFLVHFIARQMTGPLLPAIEADLGIRHAQSGLFIFMIGCGFFTSQMGAAFLIAARGYRFCILLSLWGTAGAIALVAVSESAWALCAAFLGLGITGGLYIPAGIALITVLIRPQDWGKAMGIHELAPNLALITVPFMATAAVSLGSWRMGYGCTAVLLAVLGVAYATWGTDGPDRPSPPNFHQVRSIIANRSFWLLGVLVSLAVGVETGVYSMVPLFLVNERAYDLAAANQLLGLSRIPGLIMVLLSGWVADRLGIRTTIALALGLTGAAVVVLGLGPGWAAAPAVFLQSAACACLFPPILSAASRISSSQDRALTFALNLAVAPVIGGGMLPAAIALAGDMGSFGLGLAGAGVLTMAGIGLVPLLGRR